MLIPSLEEQQPENSTVAWEARGVAVCMDQRPPWAPPAGHSPPHGEHQDFLKAVIPGHEVRSPECGWLTLTHRTATPGGQRAGMLTRFQLPQQSLTQHGFHRTVGDPGI